jgi:hypothetical protein
MSISLLSRPSTPHIMREGDRSRWQCIHAPPWLRVHRHLLMCLIRCAYCRALRWPTSATSSSTAAGARIVTSPLSATVKGAATSRVATSREILNLLRWYKRHPRHVLDPPTAPSRGPAIDVISNLGGGHGRTHRQLPLGGLPSMSSPISMVDAARSTGSAP